MNAVTTTEARAVNTAANVLQAADPIAVTATTQSEDKTLRIAGRSAEPCSPAADMTAGVNATQIRPSISRTHLPSRVSM